MSRFKVIDFPLAGLKQVERQAIGDIRGFLARIFCAEEMAIIGWEQPIAQINHTFTQKKGTVRGLHYQIHPHAEMKLVSCIRGEVWDVAVDVRKGSSTFLQWHGQTLSAENGRALLIPEGFAHGFQTLTDDVELIYCHSVSYNSIAEAGLNPKDPALSIGWPLEFTEISSRDLSHPMLNTQFEGVSL